MPRRRFAVGCGLVVLVVLLVAGCGLAAAISSLPAGEHPDVDFRSVEISAARAAASEELDAELAEVVRRSGLEVVGPRARRDRCEAGQDNFTRQDRYAYTCWLEIRQIVALAAPFRANASRLGEALVDGDCPNGTDTDRAVAEYFDDVQDINSSRGDCTPGQSVGAPEIEGWLPARPTADELERARSFFETQQRCWSSVVREHCEVLPLVLRRVLPAVPQDAEYLAVLVARDSYYSVVWACPWPASWFAERCHS
jgi:hypothetical protein